MKAQGAAGNLPADQSEKSTAGKMPAAPWRCGLTCARFIVPIHAENERRLSMNRPTPNPSREESERSSAPCQFPSWEGLGVGSWSQCMAKNESRLSRNRKVGQASRLPYVRPASVRGPNARSKDSGGSP